MLGGADDQPAAGAKAWIASASASVPPEVKTRSAGRAPNRAASDLAGILQDPARGAARGVYRGGIAGHFQRRQHRGARLRAQRFVALASR